MKIAAWFGAMTMALGAACQATPIVSVASFSAPVLDLKEPILPTGSADFAKSVMDEMVAASQDVRSGISPDAAVGHYVIVVVKLPTGDPQSLQKG